MNDIAETKQCTNCKLEILSSNYTIHLVHCQRNFYLCSACEQPVNNNDRTEHDKTNHLVIHCSKCQLALEIYFLDDHLTNDCPDRIVKCQICNIDVKATDIAEHENYCGSRTEKCPECGEFVMLKYKSLHIDSNHTFIKPTDGFSPSWQYGRRTLFNFIPDLSRKSNKPLPIFKRKSSEQFRRSRNAGSSETKDDANEVVTRNFDSSSSEKIDPVKSKIRNVLESKEVKRLTKKNLDEWPALLHLKTLQISEEKDNTIGLNTSNFRENDVNEESDLMYAIQVSQEISSDIQKKEVSKEGKTWKNCFRPLVANELSMEKFVQKNVLEKTIKRVNEDPKSDFDYFDNKHNNVKLPCEFCGNLITSRDLILHQSRCSCYMSDTYNASDRNRILHFNVDVEQKIPCGLCKKFFQLSVLENHQVHCQRNPIKSFKNQDKGSYSKNLKTLNKKSEKGLQNELEHSTPQLNRVGTQSEWLSKLSRSSEGGKNERNESLSHESGVITETTKLQVSRKST